MKTTQRDIRNMIKYGSAKDVTDYSANELYKLQAQEGGTDEIAYSVGMYGVNGKVVRGRNSGTLYATSARTAAAFVL